MKKSRFIRSVVFILLVGVLLYGLCDMFEHNNDYIIQRFNTYDSFDENTVDVAFIGTSGMDRYWIAAKAFEESGITAYSFSSDATPSWLYMSLLKQVTKKQSPKLVIFDMRPFLNTYKKGKINDTASRRVIDSLDFFSLSRFDAIDRSLEVLSEYNDDISRYDASYFLSFIKYHNMWEDSASFDELKDPESDYLGFFIHDTLTTKSADGVEKKPATDERLPLDELCLSQLNELLDYVETQDYEVLFLDTAHTYKENEQERLNTLCDILDERNIKYVINTLDEDMYDFDTDFYNSRHVNYYGAEKFTAWFRDYLLENYDLPDHRDDENCKSWYGVYDNIKDKVASLEKKDK